ncbi:hypothetical protein OAS86_03075 [Gammaproteobacteria bacterium]|nr:hypothetical protein [Gammaproteobacteria bacterium]
MTGSARPVFGFVVAMAFSLGGLADSNVTPITEDSLPFLYESRADIPAPEHTLAEIMSSDYRSARDEFTRYDLMETIRPVIERRLQEYGAANTVSVTFGTRLDDYDFDQQAFSTGLTPNTFLEPTTGYGVTFMPDPRISTLPVPLDHAKTLAGSLRNNRRATVHITGTIDHVSEETSKFYGRKMLYIDVDLIEMATADGQIIGHRSLE